MSFVFCLIGCDPMWIREETCQGSGEELLGSNKEYSAIASCMLKERRQKDLDQWSI